MGKISLKMRLGLGFGALLLIIIATGMIAFTSLQRLIALSADVDRRATQVTIVQTIESKLNSQKAQLRGYLLDPRQPEELERYASNERAIADLFAQLTPLVHSEKGKEMLARIHQNVDAYHVALTEIIELQRRGKHRQAVTVLFGPRVTALRDQMSQSVSTFVEDRERLKQEGREAEAGAESRVVSLILALIAIGVVLGLVVAMVIARCVSAAICDMVSTIEEVAANNLAIADVEIASRDEMGKAGLALNRMKNNLRQVILAIARTAEHVASASEELSSSAAQQAQSAETQKDQATQVATAMQEMSSTVLQVSENSNRAAESSRHAAETARQGGAIVDDTLGKMRAIAESVSATATKMKELGKSSDQIGRIINVIEDIADQTNLLALNAAIEAARAGEQGRGFAVVADEVRKLAERTTSATKEIAQMIKNIQDETKGAVAAMENGTEQVEEGLSSTAKAGDSLKQIIQMAEQVGEMIMHIANASSEQSSAAEEINNNVERIAKLVTESAVGAQHSAQACQDLSGLAFDLQKMVSNFKVEESNGSQQVFRSEKPCPLVPHEEALKTFAAGAD